MERRDIFMVATCEEMQNFLQVRELSENFGEISVIFSR